MSRQCSGIRRDGQRCRGIAATGSDWCPAHDPARKEARRRAASKGGRSKGSARVHELHRRLEHLASKVIEGELETSRGAVAGQLISAQIRLLDYERKSTELEELAAKLEELERAYRPRSA